MTNHHQMSGERWHNSETKRGGILGVWFMPDNVVIWMLKTLYWYVQLNVQQLKNI